MATTIQISEELQKELSKRKIYERETYEEVIWDILEDSMELNDETVKQINKSLEQVKKGKFSTLEEVEKELR